jgi:hypothetical protein
VDFSKTLSYKGVMFSGVPNLASVFGYINASWTLKADLICAYVARLIAYMDRKGYAQVTPRNYEPAMPAAAFIEHFSSGYIQRSLAHMPKQGLKAPWRVNQNYFADIVSLRYARIANKALEFSSPRAALEVVAGSASAARRAGVGREGESYSDVIRR